MTRSIRRRFGFVIVVISLCGALAACGGDGVSGSKRTSKQQGNAAPADTSAKTLAPHLIGPQDLMRTKPQTPERSLLAFWQAVQFLNGPRAYGLLSKRLTDTVSRGAFERDLPLASPRFNSRPQIIQRHTSGNTADLSVALLFYGPDGKVVAITPLTFAFVDESGRWRLADLKYFTKKAAESRAVKRG